MESPFDIAADLDTPVSAFVKLRPLRPRFLLESVEGGERIGRYSFIGFGDAMTVRLTNDAFLVDGAARPAPSSRDAFLSALREALMMAPRLSPHVPGVPFAGGLVGWTGFAAAGRFDRVSLRSDDDTPDAAYVAPRSVLVFDHLTRRAALVHAGDEEDRRVLRRAVIDVLRGPLPLMPSGGCVDDAVPSMSEAQFRDAVHRAHAAIHDGDVYQLVLSVQFGGRTDVHPFEVYRALRVLNPSPYMYYIAAEGTTVIGSSPEALVRLTPDGAAHLRPIAGTRPRGRDDAQDRALEQELLADAKEAAEHVMLVDLARNDAGRVAVAGSVCVEPYRAIERYSHVMHMVSGVRAELHPSADAFDLFAAAFPAGTVVGAPKIRAMELIDAIEPVPRGVYAGTVGYFGHGGAMDHAIAIRTIVMQGDTYRYQAGAGIVADSVAANEHAEIAAKSAALCAALSLAAEGLS